MDTSPHDQAAADERIEELRKQRNANTRRAYDADVAHYVAWCAAHGHVALPALPKTLERYFEALYSGTAERAPGTDGALRKGRWQMATIARRKSSISKMHKKAGFRDGANPTTDHDLLGVLRNMREQVGTAQTRKEPLLPDVLAQVAGAMATSPRARDTRDLALVLIGFAAALRRAELVALDHAHLRFDAGGVRIFLPRRKNDQEGQGTYIGVSRGRGPTCPVRALRTWLARLGTGTGPVFVGIDRDGFYQKRIHAYQVAVAVKRVAARAGLDPAMFGGHSLRRGFVTAADRADRSTSSIMRQTGHKTEKMVRVYIKEDIDWSRNPDRGLL